MSDSNSRDAETRGTGVVRSRKIAAYGGVQDEDELPLIERATCLLNRYVK